MVTGLDIVNKGLWTINTFNPSYNSRIGELRCHPDQPPHQCDCSGLWCYVMNALGLATACVSSATFAQIGHQQGLGVSMQHACSHPGHFLIRGPDQGQSGYGNKGHIGATVGDGRMMNGWFWMGHSVEARGTFSGVDTFEADDIGWSYAMKVPGVNYDGVAQAPKVKPKSKPKQEGAVIFLPDQSVTNWRPIGVQVVDHTIFVYNVSKNPFKEGHLVKAGNMHKLILDLAAGEEVLGITDRRPDGAFCPHAAPVEVMTNLPSDPDDRGQPRLVLHRAA